MWLKRTNAEDADFRTLVGLLDRELAIVDGEDHAFFSQYNKILDIPYVVVAYLNEEPVGCGAIKGFDDETMEVKRMYVKENHRGQRVAPAVLDELEKWTAELGFRYCILETSTRLPSAVKLYEREGYQRIENYGQYRNVVTSICMRKQVGI